MEHDVDISPRLAYTKALIRKGARDGSLAKCLVTAQRKSLHVPKQPFKVKKLDVVALVAINALLVWGVTMVTW